MLGGNAEERGDEAKEGMEKSEGSPSRRRDGFSFSHVVVRAEYEAQRSLRQRLSSGEEEESEEMRGMHAPLGSDREKASRVPLQSHERFFSS